MKKILALVLALCMILALAACGDSTPAPAAETAAPAAEGSTEEASGKTFQFEGKFEEQGEYASMLNNAFLLTLAADGTAVCDKYAFSNYDASDAATNPTYSQSYLSGTWKEVEKDGEGVLVADGGAVGGQGQQEGVIEHGGVLALLLELALELEGLGGGGLLRRGVGLGVGLSLGLGVGLGVG